MASASLEISHFDRAIESSVSTLGDNRIKETTSLERKVIRLRVCRRATANLESPGNTSCQRVICCLKLQGPLLYRTSG